MEGIKMLMIIDPVTVVRDGKQVTLKIDFNYLSFYSDNFPLKIGSGHLSYHNNVTVPGSRTVKSNYLS